jgi:hypothetical protein
MCYVAVQAATGRGRVNTSTRLPSLGFTYEL